MAEHRQVSLCHPSSLPEISTSSSFFPIMHHHPEILWAQRSNESDESKVRSPFSISCKLFTPFTEHHIPHRESPRYQRANHGLFFHWQDHDLQGHSWSVSRKSIIIAIYSQHPPIATKIIKRNTTSRSSSSMKSFLRLAFLYLRNRDSIWCSCWKKCSKIFSSRGLDLKLQKKNIKAGYWPRLTELRNNFVKTNFNRWVDEDEQDGAPDQNDFDTDGMGGMGGLGGMGGMGGMDFEKVSKACFHPHVSCRPFFHIDDGANAS